MKQYYFRPLRESGFKLSDEECRRILNKAEYGVLSTYGRDLFPHSVPMNFVFDGRRIYMNTANEGHLLESINVNGHVSFCVVESAKVVPAEFKSYYKSVIAYGACDPIYMKNQKFYALESLVLKYCPGLYKQGVEHIRKHWNDTTVLCMHVLHISGKCNELPNTNT